ncbi:hypothetical protein ACFYOV_07900 [Streptomyces sp. NPDC005931]|uniref:hypothetical protein n=1 Tax=Streptomyces sp. NPDC005931 TaxID=3364737 RepID=UPI00369D494F
MGVFARLLRRSKATEEARTAEAQVAGDETAAAPGSEEASGARADGTAARPGAAREAAEVAGTATTKESGEGSQTGEPAAKETGAVAGDGSVEIPRQQSSDAAADSGAGDGART